MTLNSFIKEIRTATKLNSYEFAYLLGISPKNLQQIENDWTLVSKPTLKKIAELTGSTPQDIKLMAYNTKRSVWFDDHQKMYDSSIENTKKLFERVDLKTLTEKGREFNIINPPA